MHANGEYKFTPHFDLKVNVKNKRIHKESKKKKPHCFHSLV